MTNECKIYDSPEHTKQNLGSHLFKSQITMELSLNPTASRRLSCSPPTDLSSCFQEPQQFLLYALIQFYSQGISYPDSKSWSTYAPSGYTPLFSFWRLLSTSLNPKPYTYFFEMSFLYPTSTTAACHVKVEVESKTLNSTPVSLRYPSHTPVWQMQPIVRNLEWNKEPGGSPTAAQTNQAQVCNSEKLAPRFSLKTQNPKP